MMFITFLKINCSCLQSAVLKKNISQTFKFKSFAKIKLMITDEQYESTDAIHCHKIDASLHRQFSTVCAFKKIEKTASRSEKLNNFIVIILFTNNFSNFYFNLSK